ncbi:MAG: sugar ABC transporter permease [Candidatus Methanomethylicia archaeon]
MFLKWRGSLKKRESLSGLFFSGPAFIVLFLVILFPFTYVIYISFFKKIFGAEAVFVGLQNYIETLSDPLFYHSFYVTLFYTLISVALKLLCGLGLALLLSQNFRGRSIVRTICIIPWSLPLFVVAIIFWWFFDYNLGLANQLLSKLFNIKVPWLGVDFAVWSIIITNVWKGIPFFMVNFLGALQTVPKQLYDAAEIDGASAWNKFLHVTLPCIKYVILVVCLLSIIWTFGEFDTVFFLTRGGPGYVTFIIPILIYYHAFSRFDLGIASAVSVLTVPLFLMLIALIVRELRR